MAEGYGGSSRSFATCGYGGSAPAPTDLSGRGCGEFMLTNDDWCFTNLGNMADTVLMSTDGIGRLGWFHS